MHHEENILHPHILPEGGYSDRELDAFRKDRSIWSVHDIFPNQLKELFEVTHPHLRTSPKYDQERDRFLSRRLGQKAPGSWAYFPWSGRLVHMVGESDLFALRTNRNRDLITQEEQKILYDFVPAVVGLSVGSNIALSLLYAGIGNRAKLAEFDHLETTNLNRIQAGVADVGLGKIELTSRRIYEANPYARLSLFPDGLGRESLHEFISGDPRPRIVFEVIDNFEMKIRLRHLARERGIPVISFANIGDRIVADVERFDLDPKPEIFNGHAGRLPEEILKKPEASEEEVNRYAVRLVGNRLIPSRARESLKKINKTLAGRPQLASTVTISGGIGAYFARKIALKNPLPSGRHVIDFDTSFKPRKPTPKKRIAFG